MAFKSNVVRQFVFVFCFCGIVVCESQPAWLEESRTVFSELALCGGTQLLSVNDEGGGRLIRSRPALRKFMEEATHALCSSEIVPIKFLRYQVGSKDWNGRDTSYEFQRRPGFLFSVSQGKAKGEVCLLLAPGVAKELTVVKTEAPSQKKADLALINKIEAKTKHKVVSAEAITRAGNNVLWAVNFKQEGDKKRAGFFLEPSSAWYDEYVASCSAAQCDSFRVGGGYGIAASDFYVFTSVKWKGHDLFLVGWSAEEGTSIFSLNVDGEKIVNTDLGYLYELPV
ncbi:MAG: hypothetical protein ACKN9V_10660 [Pseudomonadota bacterium]